MDEHERCARAQKLGEDHMMCEGRFMTTDHELLSALSMMDREMLPRRFYRFAH